MKVILNKTVPKVGKEGQVVTVADGFARNYLFARGLAILADKKQIEALGRRNARVEAKSADQTAAAEELRDRVNGQTVRIEGKAGSDSTKLFGAITSQDVVEALKTQLKVEVDRKKVALIEPIKRLGVHSVQLDLHRSVDAWINVEVFDPNAIVEAPVAEAPETPVEEDLAPVEA
ncbi:MAG: 50S ribosomal protein L9 [Fimbriimonas ginsengisoli]|uniref:Large ribosomal subunit protein bL9 n=1 Tax=Fimbriimonas ginsengisoli TaxID=1005039 RepID=A0A931PTN5_FIMGI|nr:50S ribosomal protein L9 [Fimbriimonas ginsengisoli]